VNVVVVVQYRINEGRDSDVSQLWKRTVPETRDESGCLSVHVHREINDPLTVWVLQEWTSREAYDDYATHRAQSGDTGVLDEMITGKQKLFLEKVDL
jgi:quinol monooxygenase YgiN